MTKLFCSKCGSEMEIKERTGDAIRYISPTDGEYFYYEEKYDEHTVCPNWRVINGGWFVSSKFNGHDCLG